MEYTFSKYADRKLLKLPIEDQKRIVKKIEFYLNQENPLSFAKLIVGRMKNIYRFRVGEYRVIFEYDSKEILIVGVGLRKDIYK